MKCKQVDKLVSLNTRVKNTAYMISVFTANLKAMLEPQEHLEQEIIDNLEVLNSRYESLAKVIGRMLEIQMDEFDARKGMYKGDLNG